MDDLSDGLLSFGVGVALVGASFWTNSFTFNKSCSDKA